MPTSTSAAFSAAARTAGWDRPRASVAAEKAADVLVGMVQPYAAPLFEHHRSAGRRLVHEPPPGAPMVLEEGCRVGLYHAHEHVGRLLGGHAGPGPVPAGGPGGRREGGRRARGHGTALRARRPPSRRPPGPP